MKLSQIFSLFLASTAALANGDPTQPPSAFIEPSRGGAIDAGTSVGLQSVILHRKSKKSLAMIDGQMYAVGDLVGDARIVKITERFVLLDGPKGEEKMQLTPEVELTPVPAMKKRKPGSSRRDPS